MDKLYRDLIMCITIMFSTLIVLSTFDSNAETTSVKVNFTFTFLEEAFC